MILNHIYPDRFQPVDWIPHATSASEKVRNLVDRQLAKRIAKLYKDDFDLLNYSTTAHWDEY